MWFKITFNVKNYRIFVLVLYYKKCYYIYIKSKGGDEMTKAEVNLLKKYIEVCEKLKTLPKNNKNLNKNSIEIKEKERLLI